jgi:hypothetical protein
MTRAPSPGRPETARSVGASWQGPVMDAMTSLDDLAARSSCVPLRVAAAAPDFGGDVEAMLTAADGFDDDT